MCRYSETGETPWWYNTATYRHQKNRYDTLEQLLGYNTKSILPKLHNVKSQLDKSIDDQSSDSDASHNDGQCILLLRYFLCKRSCDRTMNNPRTNIARSDTKTSFNRIYWHAAEWRRYLSLSNNAIRPGYRPELPHLLGSRDCGNLAAFIVPCAQATLVRLLV